MATQKDLDVLKQKLSDLDAKLKSMGGGSAQRDPSQYKDTRSRGPVPPPQEQTRYKDTRSRGPVPRAPIDMVRDPGFGSAMDELNYRNLLAEQRQRMIANQPPVFGRPSLGPMINPETIKKARAEYMASQPKNLKYQDRMTKTKYGGEFGSSIGFGFDKWFEKNYINNPNSSLSEQERMALNPQRGQRPPQGPQVGGDFIQGRLMGAPSGQGGLGGLRPDQAGISSEQAKILDDLRKNSTTQGSIDPRDPNNFDQIALGMQNMMNFQNPNQNNFDQIALGMQNMMNSNPQQQMQNYQNLLQQGIQRSNTMNQDAASNFANMQAGAPTTQPTIPSPQLGGVTAQPRGLPRPRQPIGFGSPIGRSAF